MRKSDFNKIKNPNLFKEAVELAAIGNRGVALAIEESLRKGIPLVFGYMDKVIFRMPDGSITTKNPFKKISQKKKK